MADSICKICGKLFQTSNPHQYLCSTKCRKEYHRLYMRVYTTANPKYRKYRKQLRRKQHEAEYVPKIKYCKTCGDKLPDGRQTYCEKCLVSAFVNCGCKAGTYSYNMLFQRGYKSLEAMCIRAKQLNLL